MNTSDASTSPYESPTQELLTDTGETQPVQFFSPSCRIGRLRYLAHTGLMGLAFYAVLGIAAGVFLVGLSGSAIGTTLYWIIFAVAYIAMIYTSAVIAIQRLHDQDRSGWLWLLMFIPIVNIVIGLMLLFVPGTKGVNTYGAPPPANKTWHWIAGLALPVIAAIGIIAAVALPAYNDYVERAQAYSSQE